MSARTDPRGGYQATDIPTATRRDLPRLHFHELFGLAWKKCYAPSCRFRGLPPCALFLPIPAWFELPTPSRISPAPEGPAPLPAPVQWQRAEWNSPPPAESEVQAKNRQW